MKFRNLGWKYLKVYGEVGYQVVLEQSRGNLVFTKKGNGGLEIVENIIGAHC